MVMPEAAILSTPRTATIIQRDAATSSPLGIYWELTKPRIMILILLITLAGAWLAFPATISGMPFLHLVLGVGMLAAGLGTLNQFYERNIDGLMRRTEKRPLPSGRISATKALLFGLSTGFLGIAYLALVVNLLTAVVGVFTLISYVFLYTPLKRRTPWSTIIGAFPGAVPPLIGWTSVQGEVSVEAITLFLIMFLWQFPHFLAIAWMYREDYQRAGICMLPVIEPEGKSTSRQIVFYALVLLPVSLLPTLIGLTGNIYLIGALLLSGAYLYFSVYLAMVRSRLQAKRVLLASVFYLPLLFALMLWDKIPK
jgi:protoheme IX farnesyltransferase